MKLQVVGCSHHASSVDMRQRLAFDEHQARQALENWRSRFPDTEAVLLSTCNRVEVYAATEDDDSGGLTHENVVDFLADFHHLPTYEIFDDLFERTGEDAVRHLFTVAASLDSMVVGEPQILSQVKQAYELANQQKSTGPLTHGIFQAAVRVARRVTTETAIHQRRVSIPSIAVADFAKQLFDSFTDKRVLVVGAGEMGEETLRYLREEGAETIIVVNRNRDRAEGLAARFNGSTADWESRWDELVQADLVVTTTGANEPIITQTDFDSRVAPKRFQRPLFILDLATPRDVEAAVGDRLGVYLYCLDDLAAACNRNRELRDKELPNGLAIIEEETEAFMKDLSHRAMAPIIRRLRDDWESTKEREVQRLMNKLPNVDEKAKREIAISFDRLVNKLLHPPLESLRDRAGEGTHHGMLDALKRLFQLRD